MAGILLIQLLFLRLLVISTSSIVTEFDQPRVHDKKGASWGLAWNMYLHNQVDQLLLALQKPLEGAKDEDKPRLKTKGSYGDEPFQIAFVGDSTMLMQFTVLSSLLLARIAKNGRSQCTKIKNNEIHCTPEGYSSDTPETRVEKAVLAIKMYTTYLYMPKSIDADIVYFGSGLHLLQMVPYRISSSQEMDMWVRYDELMEDAVLHFRTKGRKRTGRVPMEVVFMTTHSISVDLFVDHYALGAPDCGHSDMLETCHLWERDQPTVNVTGRGSKYERRDICEYGCFNDNGVARLNQRAEAVMTRLHVPIVPGYDITSGQAWASERSDGRHYMELVPLELEHLLAIVMAALRRQRQTE